jgi:hypothetical protein
MTLTGSLVDTGTVATDFFGLAAMALIGRNETDTAMAVLNGRGVKFSGRGGAGTSKTTLRFMVVKVLQLKGRDLSWKDEKVYDPTVLEQAVQEIQRNSIPHKTVA